MRLKISFLVSIILVFLDGAAQFAPAAGQPGTTAIHKDSSAIVAWATGISVSRGPINISDLNQSHEGSTFASFGVPENALGPASGTSEDVVSLGDGGSATLTFSRPIKNGEGPDFCIFENAFTDTFLELAYVEVSSDGQHFVRFPAISLTQTNTQIGTFGSVDPTKIHNLAGKYRQGFGTPFDLEDLIDSANIDLDYITHLRIVDVVGSVNPQYGTLDSQGNLVNDLFPTPFYSGGFDLDAVGVLHEGTLELKETIQPIIKIFPNPNQGSFQILWQNDPILSYQLYDALGQMCTSRMTGDTMHLNENVKNGIYTLVLQTAQGIFREKIVVQKN